MFQVLFLGSLFSALLTIYILVFKKDSLKSYADYLLSMFILCLSWNVFIYLLLYYGLIIEVPYLFKSATPLAYLIPPLGYLYTRAVLYNERKIKLLDLLHFIPFVIVTISYSSFFLIPINEKRELVEDIINNLDLSYKKNAGYITETNLFLLRISQLTIYLIFQWSLILKFNKVYKTEQIEKQIKEILKWVKIFAWCCTSNLFALLSLMLLVILNISIFNNWGAINLLPLTFIAISFFIINTYLLIHPNILNGLPFVKYKTMSSDLIENETSQIPYILENFDLEIQKINDYFENEMPFLNKNLSISQVAVALDMPIRELSYILNNHYNFRFTDFVNDYRIKYIINKFNESYLDEFTIESVSLEAGFTTKSGFYKSFKKLYQTTPSEYFNKLKSI
jgi:AraC-like DNA-binding protein